MKAIIPVAGHGSRLEPHSSNIQKCLLPVAGKPVLEHILNRIEDAGISEVTLIIGHLGDHVRDFCDQFTGGISFNCIEQKERLGLGHAIKQGLENKDEPVLVILGDGILELDYRAIINSNNSTIGVVEVTNPQRFGIVEHIDGTVSKLVEKPDNPVSNLAIAGVYNIQSQSVLLNAIHYLQKNNIRTKGEYQLTDALQHMLASGEKFTIQYIDHWLDCGITETMLETNQILLERGQHNWLHPSAIIENSIIDNSTIMENCVIRDAQLHNVIMLKGSQVIGTTLNNKIIGFGEKISKVAIER